MLITTLIGFLFGFLGAMPVAGPIAVLLFARSTEGRYQSALYIGLGSVLPEASYAFLAFWGFSALLAQVSWIVPVSRGLAALILIALGVGFLRRSEPTAAPNVEKDGRWGSLVLGFSICALNPTLIVTWTGATTTLFSIGWVELRPILALPFALAAGAGILAWDLLLIALVRRFRQRFSLRTLHRVLQVFGVFLLAMGALFAWRLLDYLVG